MPNGQRPPALESAVLPRLSELLSPRPYLALITKRQGHSGRPLASKTQQIGSHRLLTPVFCSDATHAPVPAKR